MPDFAIMSYSHSFQIRPRYAETDQMGFVYYGVYAQYYEVARVEAMRNIGIHYADLERIHGIWMPVMHMEVRFLRPARYDELLTVYTIVPAVPNRDIKFRYEIKNEQGAMLNGAMVKLCFLEAATQRRISAPDFIKESLESYF